jgi:hypothetical protein
MTHVIIVSHELLSMGVKSGTAAHAPITRFAALAGPHSLCLTPRRAWSSDKWREAPYHQERHDVCYGGDDGPMR